MKSVVISDDALNDLHDGFWFYEAQQTGLGSYFANELRADISALKTTGGSHRVVHGDYHRAISVKFPYAIYYSTEQIRVTVWAVFDCRRDPDWILARLGEK